MSKALIIGTTNFIDPLSGYVLIKCAVFEGEDPFGPDLIDRAFYRYARDRNIQKDPSPSIIPYAARKTFWPIEGDDVIEQPAAFNS